MKKKTPDEMERAAVAKTKRTIIRLKHSLAADLEINDTLPDSLEEFDAALARGDRKSAAKRLNEILEG